MKNQYLITVFTPTFNRAYTLRRLYESLVCQTNQNFEWLIVDDGSSDNTEELVKAFIEERRIFVHYIKQTNGGKHRAINKGVKEAKGELFFIVDSDDYLANNAVERVIYHYFNIKDNNEFAGVCGCRAYFSGNKVGGDADFEILDCSTLDAAYKHKIKGDMAEVFRTDILKQYPFPEIDGEKFIAEGIVWNRIAAKYKLRYFNENIYFCEYLKDGLSNKSIQLRKNNPRGATLLYKELYKSNIPLIYKLRAIINYWRFRFYVKNKNGK